VFRGDVLISTDRIVSVLPWAEAGAKVRDDNNPAAYDSAFLYYPSYLYASRWLRRGEVPLWNPHVMCGTPFTASGTAGMFYPLTAPFLLAGYPEAAFGWGALIHVFLAGLFCFCLVRVLGAGTRAAMISGLVFAFNGWLAARMIDPGILHAGIWMPLVFCLYELSLRRRRILPAGLAGIAGAMPVLAGNLEIAVMTNVMMMGFMCYRAVGSRRNRLRPVAYWAFAILPGAGLAAVQYVPMVFSMTHCALSESGSWLELIRSSFGIGDMSRVFLPDLFGTADQDYFKHSIYCGVLPVFLGIYSLVGTRGRYRWFFTGAGLIAFIIALGSPLSVVLLLVPSLKQMAPHETLYIVTFVLSVMAGLGWGAIEKMKSPDRKRLLVVLAVFVPAAIIFSAEALLTGSSPAVDFSYGQALRFLLPVTIGFITLMTERIRNPLRWLIIVVIIIMDLVLWSSAMNPSYPRELLYPQTGVTKYFNEERRISRINGVGEVMPPNSATVFGLYDVGGYERLVAARFSMLAFALSGRQGYEYSENVGFDSVQSGFLDFMNTRYYLSDEWLATGDDIRLRPLMSDGARLTSSKTALPRFYVLDRWKVLDSGDEVLRELAAPGFDPAEDVFLEAGPGMPESREPEPGLSPLVPLAIRDIVYMPNSIFFVTDTNRSGLLVTSEAAAPGWRAEIDGRETEVLTVNYAFRAVMLPSGHHEVLFEYRPASQYIGGVITLISIAVVAMLLLFGAPYREEY